MSFAPIATSRGFDRGDNKLPKTITFGPFLRLTFPWNESVVPGSFRLLVIDLSYAEKVL